MAKVEELWIYPVKACQGVRVKKAKLTKTGFELDRAWCIVDEDGTNVSALESISGRKMPSLAKINVCFSADNSELYLDAQGMDRLAIPVSAAEYLQSEDIKVECSGKSTTAKEGGGWSFGFIMTKKHKEGSVWLTTFLNSFDEGGKKRFSGKSKESTYALCRSMGTGLKLMDYPPEFPIISKATVDKIPEYVDRFQDCSKVFADFAPLLILNKVMRYRHS